MRMRLKNWSAGMLALLLLLFCPAAFGQTAGSSATVSGVVLDASGGAVPGAAVRIQNPVSGYNSAVTTDSNGQFHFYNVPFDPYHLTVVAKDFAPLVQDIRVSSAVPLALQLHLTVAGTSTVVTVRTGSEDLLYQTPTSETAISHQIIAKLPLESQSSSLSSLVTLASPGVVADSNGLFHSMGDHAENSFSVDGQPITDQQSKIFSNQLPVGAVESLKVIQGAPPAEYGDKTSLVIVATTRSGLDVSQPHGQATLSYGSFGSDNLGFDLAYGGKKWGNFIAANGLETGRFLDPPEFTVTHAKGNEQNVFDRIDYKPSAQDTFSLNFQYTRSWFQTPNSYDAQNATAWNGLVVDNHGLGPDGLPVGSQDQRSKIATFNIAPTWTRLVNPNTVLTLGGYLRQDRYHYYPSGDPFADLTPNLQFQSVGQSRRLTNSGLRADVSYVKGMHNLKAGVVYQQTFLTENDTFGIVDPTFNPVCVNSDGTAYTGSGLTDPSECGAIGLTANPSFLPLLGCYDLTRTGQLPASDGCTGSTSGEYLFRGHTDVKELALYVQDTISVKNWTFNLGIRGDVYNGITLARQAEPRLGASYYIQRTKTILRLSYAHTLETPFNENLILSSGGCLDPVVNQIMTITQGYPCITSPIDPGIRNEYHVGLEQAFGSHLVLDAEYLWVYTHNAYDFSIFGATPITFPIEWARSKTPGVAARINLTNFHGVAAYLDLAHFSARFFEPQAGGIGVTPSGQGGAGVFRIDHDESYEQTFHLQYQPWSSGPWLGFNWRYDSGLVAGPVPCAGGDCANGPNGTDSVVDVSGLSPDQQFEAGLFCGSVHATPTTPISPTGLCPASQYGSTLVKIPSPGTENNDHNPPRIAPRSLFDLVIGDDNLFRGDRYKWGLRLTVINLTNKYALYNFLSTFSGTHYVTPRTFTGQLSFSF
jgi:Carboxypeptidase regulatory-like domain